MFCSRDGYRPVAVHSSVIFFCISELSSLDPMYQFSLPWFVSLYHKSIQRCAKRETIEDRISDLNSHFTRVVFESICRSLFSAHAIAFAFALCVGILRGGGGNGGGEVSFDDDVWSFVLTGTIGAAAGAASPTEHRQPNPHPSWLSDRCWDEAVTASTQLPQCQGLSDSLKEDGAGWKRFYDEASPHQAEMPGRWNKLRSGHQERSQYNAVS